MRVTFADFTLDSSTRQLHQGGRERHLSPKAFDLLAILLAHRPGVVDKETLRDKLWPGTNVVDANLNNLASEIRSVLGDDPHQPRFLRTVHRVGYAFCGAATDEPATGEGRPGPASAGRASASVSAPAPPDGDAASTLASASDRGPRAWLVWKDHAIVLSHAEQTLGRDPTCEVWIDAPGVSRRHAVIRVAIEGATPTAVLEDLGSTNGTFVGDRPVRSPVTLEDGQSIRIGEATLTFRAWSAAGQATKRIRRR